MKKLIYLFLLFPVCLAGIKSAWAQNNFDQAKMDSLKRVLSRQKTGRDSVLVLQKLVDAMPIRANETLFYRDYVSKLLELNKGANVIDPVPYQLLQKGNQYWNNKQYRESLTALQASINEFDKQHKVIYPLLNNMRFLYTFLDDEEGRFTYYQKKLEYYQVNGPVINTAPCYHCIGGYYNFKGAYNQAINNYLKGGEVYSRYDLFFYANSIAVVGNVYGLWGNNVKAMHYLKKILPLEQKLGDEYMLSYIYYSLSQVSFNEREYANALGQINDAIRYNPGNPTQRLACDLVLKADIYIKMNRASLALPILNRVKAMADSVELKTVSSNGYMEIDYGFYKYYLKENNISMAEKSLLRANKMAVEQNGVPLQLKYLRELGYFYKGQNNPALSEKYFDQYFKLVDAQQKGLDEFKVAQYEADQNDKLQRGHINALKQEKAVQEYQLSRRNALLWGSLVILLLISGLLVFIYRQLQINKKNIAFLRKTQTQLIQSEKMASLGELTAGIAHEIQNPLNFVNNFSDVNTELLDEMQQGIEKGDLAEIKSIAADIKENEKKINLHGKRADAIVKGMLQHSQSGSGAKEPTDINALAGECMRLAYHGLSAKDKSFKAEKITHFDSDLPNINVIPQDIGRVMLNLFNNAFYAVNQKAKTAGPGYKPEISVSTSTANGQVIIKVKDNGTGIPDSIKEKIMQPFFTTKPTGEGTGLGLSLTYDMVVKGHGGRIQVNSVEREGSEFVILLPLN